LSEPGTQVSTFTFLSEPCPLSGHIKPKKCYTYLNSETLILLKHTIFVILRKELVEFWDFYHATKVDAGSLKTQHPTLRYHGEKSLILSSCF
jgi:hypothetical protein